MIFVFDRWETIPFITWSRLEFWRSRETRLKLLKPYRWPWHCQGSKHQVGDIRYIKNSCWKLCHFCDDTIYNIFNIMPSCISQFEYMYMIYTSYKSQSFELWTKYSVICIYICIYKLFYDCKKNNLYYRKGTYGKEREGDRHQYQWQGVCVPGVSRGPHCTRRNGQFISNLLPSFCILSWVPKFCNDFILHVVHSYTCTCKKKIREILKLTLSTSHDFAKLIIPCIY